jgi:hypothetical protein
VPVAAVADEVDEDVVAELLTERERQARRVDARLGTSKPLARSDDQRVERESVGSVVKPTWLLQMRCTEPPTR